MTTTLKKKYKRHIESREKERERATEFVKFPKYSYYLDEKRNDGNRAMVSKCQYHYRTKTTVKIFN